MMRNLIVVFILLQACSAEHLYNFSNPEQENIGFDF